MPTWTRSNGWRAIATDATSGEETPPMPPLRALSASLLAVALAIAGAAPLAAAEIAAPDERCDFRAWSKDRDPAGLNVRAAPRRDAPVVARLPAPRDEDGESHAVEFHVVGGAPGWLLIERAEYADYGAGAKPVFAGRGWVAAALVDVGVQDEHVRRAPAATAEAVDAPRALADDTREYLALGRILACRGGWIDIEGAFRAGEATTGGRAVRGWVTGLCGNQVTTCN
jgi:hypothetical protein